MSNLSASLRPWACRDVPLLTAEEAAAWDRRAIDGSGVPERVLMENAGRSAALVLQRLFPEGPVVGVVGAGNNGGDALVVLRTLAAWGRSVRAVLVADRARPDPLLHGWTVPFVLDEELDEEGWASVLAPATVVVDGILGTGVRGAPRERQAAAIRAVRASGRPVLAMDVPSGIDPATGATPGETVRADVTVSFGAPKLGSMLHPARARVGRLVAVEIAFPPLEPDEAGAFAVTPRWASARIPVRPTDTHKNAVGRVLVVGGGEGMAGAVVLAARGALRAGAGIVRVATVPANREIVQGALPEAIWVDATDHGGLTTALASSDAVAVGPGLGTEVWARDAVSLVLERGHGAERGGAPVRSILLDADALNLLASGAVGLEASKAGHVLLTPHPGEMERLLPDDPAGGEDDRVARARAATDRFGCAVLLKGAPSVVTAPWKPVLVDTQGSSDLAAAGMGDTLSGVCGTMLAQGLEPRDAGAVGLYLCGRAARLAAKGASLTPSDVVEWLPAVLAETSALDASPDPAPLGLPFVTFDADPAR